MGEGLRGVACACGLGAEEMFGDYSDEVFACEGLGDVVIAACAEALFTVARHCVCSDGDDGDLYPLFTESSCGGVAIHPGHLHVE